MRLQQTKETRLSYQGPALFEVMMISTDVVLVRPLIYETMISPLINETMISTLIHETNHHQGGKTLWLVFRLLQIFLDI